MPRAGDGVGRFSHAAGTSGAGSRPRLGFLYVSGMLLILTFGIETGETVYFEAALVIALLGFVSTSALAKFLMRGEAIE